MSVVNKMLNDLEKREQNSDMSADYQPPQKRKLPLIWIFIAVLLVAGGVWAYVKYAPVWLAKNQKVTNISETSGNEAGTLGTNQSDNTTDSTANGSLTNSSSLDPSALADIAKIAKQETRRIQGEEPDIEKEPSPESTDGIDAQVMEGKESVNTTDDEARVVKEPMLDTQDTTTIVDEVTEITTGGVEPQPALEFVNQISPERLAESVVVKEEPRTAMAVKLSDETDIDSLKLSAQKALADKDTGRATELLSKILNEQPGNVNVRKQLASLMFASRELNKAETLLKYGLQLNPQQHDVRLMLARLYQQNERNNDALTLLQNASPDVTLNIDYYNQRASLAQRLNDFKQASQDYQILANIEPEQAKWWLGIGVSADKLNESEMAILGYTRALSLNQLDSRVTAFMQQRLRGLGR